MEKSAQDIVLAYWQAMQSNNFHNAAKHLSDDFENYAPQSSELITGRENFAAVNKHYPAHGKWNFTVKKIVSDGETVVTDVSITDGTQIATAITFHTVKNGQITRQTEYWPDPYPAPEWRKQWVSSSTILSD